MELEQETAALRAQLEADDAFWEDRRRADFRTEEERIRAGYLGM